MDTAITKEMYKEMGIDGKVYSFGQEIAESLKQRFEEIDRVAEYNQLKVVHAMQQCRASEACLYASSGYGYNDVGRDTLEEIYAATFHTESALVRPEGESGKVSTSTPLLCSRCAASISFSSSIPAGGASSTAISFFLPSASLLW